MMGYGTHQSVMPRHDAEAFAQGCLPVLGGHSLFQIVDEGEMGIVQGPYPLHHPDAPVEVGGEAVLQVVGFYKGSFGKEGLPDRYAHSDGRKEVSHSLNPIELLKNPSWITLVTLLVIILVIALVVVLVRRFVFGRRRHYRGW